MGGIFLAVAVMLLILSKTRSSLLHPEITPVAKADSKIHGTMILIALIIIFAFIYFPDVQILNNQS
jgi:hypothetical protein